MQELQLVLIIVGALAIAAILFHGLWTSKKESKGKFSQRAKSDDKVSDALIDGSDDFDIIKKEKSDSGFGVERHFANDPLEMDDPLDDGEDYLEPTDKQESIHTEATDDEELPQVTLLDDIDDPILEDRVIFSDGDDEIILKPKKAVAPSPAVKVEDEPLPELKEEPDNLAKVEPEVVEEQEPEEEELEVIVLHVHCAGEEPFVGTKLFDSMQQNGLLYGEMDIYHRHNDISGTGKVLFSVANMMQPGTLKHDNPATFTTKGISFFMTLPCFGDAEQNFKLMLKTAQQIADDLRANVLDDQRNLMTPNKLAVYRTQIREFKARSSRT